MTTEVVLHSEQSGIDESDRVVLRDQEAFETWWSDAHERLSPEPSPPAVDFDRRIVVAAALGSKPTGGYAIEIPEVRGEGSRLWVVVRATVPGPTCAVTQALTAPVVAVVVERAPDVRFVEQEETREC